jgi:hypothetical protein
VLISGPKTSLGDILLFYPQLVIPGFKSIFKNNMTPFI